MGLFDLFKKKDNGVALGAPMKGKCVSIREVPDPTFGEEILGKGIAIIPSDGRVYAPADGGDQHGIPDGTRGWDDCGRGGAVDPYRSGYGGAERSALYH